MGTGTIKADRHQIGQSGTLSQNFSWEVPQVQDGTLKLVRGNAGAGTQDVIKIAADGGMTAGVAPSFSAHANAVTSIANSTNTKVNFQIADWDTNSNYAIGTSRFQPTVAGYYHVSVLTSLTSAVATAISFIYKNGVEYRRGIQLNSTNFVSSFVSGLVFLNGTTDYIEGWTFQTLGSAQNTNVAAANFNVFEAHFVRGA